MAPDPLQDVIVDSHADCKRWLQVHIHMIDGFCVAIKEDGGDLKPCAPELFNVPKDVIHIG